MSQTLEAPKANLKPQMARLTLSMPLGERAVEDGDCLAVGPEVDVERIRTWAEGCAARGIYEVQITAEGQPQPPRDVILRLRDIVATAMADVVTADDVAEVMTQNAEVNARKAVAQSPRVCVPPGMPGCTVVVLGAGPSVTPERRTKLLGLLQKQWNRSAEKLAFYVTDRAITDERVRSFDPHAVVTLEPRRVKLEAKVDKYARAVTVAHIFCCPERVPDGRVAWVQQAFCHISSVPGWVPEIPPVRSVSALAVWASALVRPKRIVLYGCDHALAGGERYGSAVLPVQSGELAPPQRITAPAIGGGEVETMPNYQLGIYELARASEHLKNLKIEVVNATAEGAILPGWEHMDIEQALGE